MQKKGKELVKSMIAHAAKEAKAKGSQQCADSIKDHEPEITGAKKKLKEQGSSSRKSLSSISKQKRNMSDDVSDTEEALKRQKTDIPSSTLELAIAKSLPVVEAEENKALALLDAKKTYYPFGVNAVFNIDVLRCFPAPAHFVYRRLNSDWVRMLTLDMIRDTKFEEILGIVMPCDDQLKAPLQTYNMNDINCTNFWIISGQHSISAAKRLQKSNLPVVTQKLKDQF